MEKTINSMRFDVETIKSRLDRAYDVSPNEIRNLWIRVLNGINEIVAELDTPFIHIEVFRSYVYGSAHCHKYEQSQSIRYNRLGDHNKAFHMSQFVKMGKIIDNVEKYAKEQP